jgi:hypothetical protein
MAEDTHESYWAPFKALAEAGQYNEIADRIAGVADPKERVALYRFTVRGLMFREWANKKLEPLILLGDLAIATALQIGETDEANIICYNMSSNLAGCWNDGFERRKEHFEKGLAYAERALEFRKQLKKGPGPFFMAYWAKGIHQYFLGDLVGAEQSFELSLNFAIEGAKAAGKTTEIVKEAPFGVLLGTGYLAIVRMARGMASERQAFDVVIAAFEGMKGLSDDAKMDAEIGLAQLKNAVV